MSKHTRNSVVTALIMVALVLVMWFFPCPASASIFGNNSSIFFDNYSYKAAVIKLTASQSILIEVRSWQDYKDSDTITLTDTDGMNYYTSSDNVILLSEMPPRDSAIYQALSQ